MNNRQIKFRALPFFNGTIDSDKEFLHGSDLRIKDDRLWLNGVKCQIETLGQCTGLKDRNGVEIYEEDVCIADHGFVGKKCLVRYVSSKAAFMFEVLEDVTSADYRRLQGQLRYINQYKFQTSDKIEIIGNIHQNPELIK